MMMTFSSGRSTSTSLLTNDKVVVVGGHIGDDDLFIWSLNINIYRLNRKKFIDQ